MVLVLFISGEPVLALIITVYITSVARGEGGRGGGNCPPPPNNAFSEFCRYIWKSVGTCKPTSISFVSTKFLKYQQIIERNSTF